MSRPRPKQNSDSEFSSRWRVARACARCHRLKSRCVYADPNHRSCERCIASNLPCSVDKDPTARSAKRRQIKLPVRTEQQVLEKVARLLEEAEREFERMPEREGGSEGEGSSNMLDLANGTIIGVGHGHVSSFGTHSGESEVNGFKNIGKNNHIGDGCNNGAYRKFNQIVTHKTNQGITGLGSGEDDGSHSNGMAQNHHNSAMASAIVEMASRVKLRSQQFSQEARGIAGANAPEARTNHSEMDLIRNIGRHVERGDINSFETQSKSNIPASRVAKAYSSDDVTPAAIRAYIATRLPEAEARARYGFFHDSMAATFPVITFPHSLYDYNTALEESPLLVLACIYVTTISGRYFNGEHTRWIKEETRGDLHLRARSIPRSHRPSHEIFNKIPDNQSYNQRIGSELLDLLNQAIAHTVYIEASDFTFHLVYVCIILSSWGVPSSHVHQYKTQIDLVTAYSVAVCMDAGNLGGTVSAGPRDENQTNNLRAFVAVYCCCGLLYFALPRFALPAWSPKHEAAVAVLSQADHFLCFCTRVVHMGEQLSGYFDANGGSINLLTSEQELGGLSGLDPCRPRKHSQIFQKLSAELDLREAQLTSLIEESGVLGVPLGEQAEAHPGERYFLIFTYYHLVMMIHDHAVSWSIYHLTADHEHQAHRPYFPDLDRSMVTSHIVRFGQVCERILDCFIEACNYRNAVYPTVFYYRALTALISLIRLMVLLKSDISMQYFPDIHRLSFRLQPLYSEVSRVLHSADATMDHRVSKRFSTILERIGRWVQVVMDNDPHRPTRPSHGVDFLRLTDMSKGQELEKLTDPHISVHDTRSSVPRQKSVVLEHNEDPIAEKNASDPHFAHDFPAADDTNFSFRDMFKEIDEDVIRYLNPFDTFDPNFPFPFDS